ncbi:MAG: DUF4065 domain-containing protein [Pseudonocardiales bacterium]|jgi:uncharacterized phage-associated protein|nr:DUF4065 domain-containing protein [Pseudonocardiales bacterium]
MPLSACDVAAALRDRLPGLPTKKLHKLLYYCQGHHLATFGEPLFSETISAWDMGPVVGALWYAEKQGNISKVHREMDEAQLNTIGYVLSRYGALTGQDLEHLTHSEEPWKLADSGRRPGESARIKPEWIRQYFRTSGRAGNDEDDALLDSAAVTRWLQGAEQRREAPGRPHSREELVARLEELGVRLNPSD